MHDLEQAAQRLFRYEVASASEISQAWEIMQDLERAMYWNSSWDRPRIMIDFFCDLAPFEDVKAPRCAHIAFIWALAEHMSDFDFVPHHLLQEVREALIGHTLDNPVDEQLVGYHVVSDADRAFRDSLPDKLRIYRGQEAGIQIGCSWTTELKEAIPFAIRGSRGRSNKNPIIFYADVPKDAIQLFLNGREEFEAVWLSIECEGEADGHMTVKEAVAAVKAEKREEAA